MLRSDEKKKNRTAIFVAIKYKHRSMKHFLLLFLLGTICSMLYAQEAVLTIRVEAPTDTPPGDSIRVIGNQPVWGYWIYPKSPSLARIAASTWEGTYRFPVGTEVEFKITRGSYFKEALYNNNGHPPTSVKFTLNKDTTVQLVPSAWNDQYQRSITGEVRYHHQFSSPLLRHTRNIVVWLPPSYAEQPDKQYPVLYAHDGQNLFDHTNLSGNEWRMDEVADSLMRSHEIEEFIIVGIANTADRWIEYSGTPEGRRYLTFVAEELKPFIDRTYRTKPDRENTAIIGSSMGGLISLYMLWHYPEVFSKAACLSSGFYFDDGDILHQIREDSAPLNNTSIYLDCGGKGLDYDFLPDNEEMNRLLSDNPHIRLHYEAFPDDDHNEKAWSTRLPVSFKFLFSK